MSFAYNVITQDGVNLIAQATSSNPIVFIGCLSSATAAVSKEDLATKTMAFYDGKSGVIYSASAQRNVARIMMSFDNVGLQSPQLIKSACVLGRLYNQTDDEAVIVSALSDADSQIFIPDNTAPKVMINVPSNITIKTDDDIATVGAEYASLADLERFVSIHKAGNPYEGDDAQIIYGQKWFKDLIYSSEGIYKVSSGPWFWSSSGDDIQRIKSIDHVGETNRPMSFGFYSDIHGIQSDVNIASVEEISIKDTNNTTKRTGAIELKVQTQDSTGSAQITLNSNYLSSTGTDASGDICAQSDNILLDAKKISINTTQNLLLASKQTTHIISCYNTLDPFNNPPYANISTFYHNSTDFHIELKLKKNSSNEYNILFTPSSTEDEAFLYPHQDGKIDLGKKNNRWDNVYANTFTGNIDGATTIKSKNNASVGIIGDDGIWLLSAKTDSGGSDNALIYFNKETNISAFAFYPYDTIHLGTPTYKWESVNAKKFVGNLNGLIPTASTSTTPPIGSIFLAHIKCRSTMQGYRNVGETVDNDDYIIKKAMLCVDSNKNVTAEEELYGTAITTGTYKLLSSIDGLSANDVSVALVMRIE